MLEIPSIASANTLAKRIEHTLVGPSTDVVSTNEVSKAVSKLSGDSSPQLIDEVSIRTEVPRVVPKFTDVSCPQ